MVAVETALLRIVAARNLLDRLKTMVAAKKMDDLTAWREEATSSELGSFTFSVRDDEAVIQAAIVQP